MKIYLAHASGFDYHAELYAPIKGAAFYAEHDVVLPHDHQAEPEDSSQIIAKSNLVIAECSYPSTGMGIELGWANKMGVPILFIHRADAVVSSSLKIISSDFIAYQDGQDLVCQLEAWFQNA